MSLPMRERGLKPCKCGMELRQTVVAPHAGAWIETGLSPISSKKFSVAPHAGAKNLAFQSSRGVSPYF